jgi:membrane-bound acyltransferase YfiQ involved in biofilm formation
MSFGLYLVGFVLVIAGTAWALSLMHVPAVYIAVACVIMLGLGIVSGVGKTRTKDT